MNRQQFLDTLRQGLAPLPEEEIENAIGFYTEHFDEAGNENEAEVLAKFPHPNHIAVKLLAEFSIKEIDSPTQVKKKKSVSISTMILAIISAPITLPLTLAFILLGFSLLLVVFLVAIIPMILFSAFLMVSCISFLVILPAFVHNFATGLVYLGIFCMAAPLTYGLLVVSGEIVKKLYLFTKKQLSNMIVRRYQHEK